jgi:hypothetical protein
MAEVQREPHRVRELVGAIAPRITGRCAPMTAPVMRAASARDGKEREVPWRIAGL